MVNRLGFDLHSSNELLSKIPFACHLYMFFEEMLIQVVYLF